MQSLYITEKKKMDSFFVIDNKSLIAKYLMVNVLKLFTYMPHKFQVEKE